MTTEQRPNPYVGPRAFRQGETLYGRDREVQKLLDLLIAERIVLLYSPSGAGKSSLINAALIPRLQAEDFRVLPAVRVNTEVPPELVQQNGHINRYVLSALLSLEEGLPREQQKPLEELARMSVNDYLQQALGRGAQTTAEQSQSQTTAEVLIFDQFEEIITIDPANTIDRVEFFKQLGDALRDRSRWALFAMREDFIATLDPYVRNLPTRLHNTFRLDLLGPESARTAMQKPARQVRVDFTDEAALKLTDDLRRVRVQRPDGTFAEQPGQHIEPVQLQVVCYRLWEQLPREAIAIQVTDVASVGDVDTVLANYYTDSVTTTAQATGVAERTIRDWFERELITAQGIRGQVLYGSEQSRQLGERAIRQLIDAHIVRAEERRGATWFELAHDRLIEPVRKSNAAWREAHLSPLQRQAELWEQQDRSDGLLLRGTALSEAELWAKDHAIALTEVERDFLAACRKARAAEKRERRNNRVIRGLAVAALVALILAIGGMLAASQQTQIAQEQRATAEAASQDANAQKLKAETALGEAQEQRATAEAASQDANTQKLKAEAALGEAQKQQQLSRSRELAAIALSQLAIDPERGVLIAIEAAQAADTFEAQEALRQLLAALGIGIVLRGEDFRIEQAAYSPDGKQIVTTGVDRTARVWDAGTGKILMVLRGHDDMVRSARFSPDGRQIVTASNDATARIWDAATGKEIAVLRGHTDLVADARFSPDGQQIVTASYDGTARVWDAATGKELSVLRGHETGIYTAHFSPDGQKIVTPSWDKTARVWDAATGKELAVLRGHTDYIPSSEFSPDGKQIVTASADGTARVWDATSGRELAVLRGHSEAVNSARFSPDGKLIVTSSRDQTARVWDAMTYRVVIVLNGHELDVTDAQFSPDSRQIVTTSNDKTVRVWDVATGKAVSVLRGHSNGIYTAQFLPSGRQILSVSNDGTARIFVARLEDLLATAKAYANRVLTCQERVQYLREDLACPTPTPQPTPLG
jgi:WD40 repeat protein